MSEDEVRALIRHYADMLSDGALTGRQEDIKRIANRITELAQLTRDPLYQPHS